MAGLNPHLDRLTSTDLPSGTVVGRNSFGQSRYSLCPPRGSSGHYAILVYPLPHRVPVATGFDAETLIEHTLVHVAASEGELFLSYSRR